MYSLDAVHAMPIGRGSVVEAAVQDRGFETHCKGALVGAV